jgi:hypothetical protein
VTYGFEPRADLTGPLSASRVLEGHGARARGSCSTVPSTSCVLRVPGRHNLLNACSSLPRGGDTELRRTTPDAVLDGLASVSARPTPLRGPG